jgi:acetyl esterase/lipase
MEVWSPARANGTAVLVAGGGGYRSIALGTESWPAARWLNERNITAFVLSYRLPGEGWTDGPLAPLQDAQRALRLIRAGAGQFGIDGERIGVLGFSAGGHLMGLAATRPEFRSYEPVDAADDLSARPAFAALIYPIITLQAPYDHTYTRRMLVGDHPTAAAAAQWSVETHVTARCPPVFLVQAKDDPISNPANTVLMEKACERVGVPVELHQFPVGGHGFGMGRAGTPAAAWPAYFARWLSAMVG